MKAALQRLRDFVVELIRRQPVRVATAIATVVVVLVPDAVDQEQLAAIIAKALALLAGGEGLRLLVFSPATVEAILERVGRGARG